tara:strand:- start:1642 stop:2931 length:1290 start_codon:yes stop_codon:yes gene_type:complete
MLKTTTLKTWLELFPEHIYGPVRNSPPITHHIKLPSREGAAGIDLEVIFLALDQPKDVRKLLSLEVTGGWINEARELPKSIVDGLTHRVGRYPVKEDGGPTWRGVILDTNPCDDDHWIYRLSEKEPPKGKFAWKFFRQPPGVFEAKEVPEEMPEAQGFVHSAGKWWKTNDKAENLNNLPVGYYEQLLGGKNLDWIRCYAEGKFTYVQEGKPVWSEYDDASMVDDCQILDGVPIQIGLDFGLTPAAVFAQRTPKGVWNVLHELVTFDMGLERFCTLLKEDIDRFFPKHELQIWGDPAGMQRDQIFENTSFEHLKTHGLFAKPTATNDFRTRREALAMPMTRLVENKPGFRIDRKCVRLRKSLSGGYHFKRVAIGAGQERFRDTPNKNEHSHIGDAAGYCLLGGGEHRRMTKGNRPHLKPMVAKIDFDPLQ